MVFFFSLFLFRKIITISFCEKYAKEINSAYVFLGNKEIYIALLRIANIAMETQNGTTVPNVIKLNHATILRDP